jgi:hypothetical protein
MSNIVADAHKHFFTNCLFLCLNIHSQPRSLLRTELRVPRNTASKIATTHALFSHVWTLPTRIPTPHALISMSEYCKQGSISNVELHFPCLNIAGNDLDHMLDYTSQLWTLATKTPTPNVQFLKSGHCQKRITPMLDFPIPNTLNKTLNLIRNYISHTWRLQARIPTQHALHFPRLITYNKDSNLIWYYSSKFLYKYPAPCCLSS